MDFPKGTSVASAMEQQEDLRQVGDAFLAGGATVQRTVNIWGRDKRNIKNTVRFRYAKNLNQFYIGQFQLRFDESGFSWLTNEVEDLMLSEATT